MGLSLVLGLMLAVAGGAVAVGVSVWFSNDPSCLWGIVPVVWGLYGIQSASRGTNPWLPAGFGLILGACFVGVGVVSYYTHDQTSLWALWLVSWITNYLSPRQRAVPLQEN